MVLGACRVQECEEREAPHDGFGLPAVSQVAAAEHERWVATLLPSCSLREGQIEPPEPRESCQKQLLIHFPSMLQGASYASRAQTWLALKSRQNLQFRGRHKCQRPRAVSAPTLRQ